MRIPRFVRNWFDVKCEKIVSYDGRFFKIEGPDVSIPPIDISTIKIETEKKKISEVAELTDSLDYHQYILCKEAQRKNHDDPEREKIEKIRIAGIHLFANVRAALAVATSGIEGHTGNLNQTLKDLQDFNRKVVQNVIRDVFTDVFTDDDFDSPQSLGNAKPPKPPPENSPESYKSKKKKTKKKTTKKSKTDPKIEIVKEKLMDENVTFSLNYSMISPKDFQIRKTKSKMNAYKIKSKSVSDAISISKLNEKRLDETLWIKPFYQKFKEQGYDVKFEEKIGKFRADMILRKEHDWTICEFKQHPEKIRNQTFKRMEVMKKTIFEIYPANNVNLMIITPKKVSSKIQQLGKKSDIQFLSN